MLDFPKHKHLCGQQRIDELYKSGKRFVSWPVRVTYKPLKEEKADSLVLVWAPKSLFKKAVDRNHLRRLMREAYRLNQEMIQQPYMIAFNYMDKEVQPFSVIEKAVRKALKKINS